MVHYSLGAREGTLSVLDNGSVIDKGFCGTLNAPPLFFPLSIPKNIPKSHFLCIDLFSLTSEKIEQIIHQGFTHVKIKVGKRPQEEPSYLLDLFSQKPLRLRLDFNERLSWRELSFFLRKIKGLCVDFLEDPCPYEPLLWKGLQEEGWTLACDREVARAVEFPESAAVYVVKPSVDRDYEKWDSSRCIVTSYLTHPIEQVAAACVAARLDAKGERVHGLLSHVVYPPNPFSLCLNWEGPDFLIDKEGFQQAYERLQLG